VALLKMKEKVERSRIKTRPDEVMTVPAYFKDIL
jgi:hypothetical protein